MAWLASHWYLNRHPLPVGANGMAQVAVDASPFITLAKRVAIQHGLDPILVCAVIEQESNWNPWAVRYEPGFLSKYVAPLYTGGHISATEAYTRSMSWGLGQVMGQTARELGFEGPSLAELCDPPIGIEYLCRKLKKCFAKANDPVIALLAYNGGSNAQYAVEVIARKANYGQSASA